MDSKLEINLNFFFFFGLTQTHLTFGQEFTDAVEAKQVAQQEAERARYIVEKVIKFIRAR